MLEYDFIILGAGASGLSLAMRMMNSVQLADKKILIVDKERKIANDKTWCFWEKNAGYFESIVHKKWDGLGFYGEKTELNLAIAPYSYKMIRSIDFYTYCFERIGKSGNVDVIFGEIKSVISDTRSVSIHLSDREVKCTPAIVFNSLYHPPVKPARLHLLQHFKGWLIETKQPFFNDKRAVLMDFRVQQQHGTTFAYVLPTSPTVALIEYTLFTASTLPSEEYDIELDKYISNTLKIEEYSVRETEFGIIPMTDASFNFFENGMYNIGTAGGQTKASTGYTFQFIQKQSENIAKCLCAGRSLSTFAATDRRFHFYDRVLLQLLATRQLEGRAIFSRLFERNKASRIFKFLDNETSLFEELPLLASLQVLPFLRAALYNSFK